MYISLDYGHLRTEIQHNLHHQYYDPHQLTTQHTFHQYLNRRETERVVCEEGEEKCNVCRGADGAEVKEVEEQSESESSENGSRNKEEINTAEAEQDEARRVFEQQQQARRGPRQTMIQQRQQEFADIEWLRRQLA
jgi:hypothetical protein